MPFRTRRSSTRGIPAAQVFVASLDYGSDLSSPTGANPATIDTANFSFSARAQLENIVVDNVAAVPKASTWAMIILGFAGVGFMAYRRKMIVALAAA